MVTESMAASKFSVAAILLVVVFAAAAADAAAATAGPSVDAVCGTVEYPALCRKLIETYHPASVRALTESSFQDTIKRLRLGKLKCDAVSRLFAKNDTSGARDITACCGYYQEIGDDLQKKAPAMIKNGDGDGLLDAGSYAASVVGSCYDLFDVNGEYAGRMKFPGSPIYYNLMKHVTNMITLTCRAFPSACPQRPPV